MKIIFYFLAAWALFSLIGVFVMEPTCRECSGDGFKLIRGMVYDSSLCPQCDGTGTRGRGRIVGAAIATKRALLSWLTVCGEDGFYRRERFRRLWWQHYRNLRRQPEPTLEGGGGDG